MRTPLEERCGGGCAIPTLWTWTHHFLEEEKKCSRDFCSATGVMLSTCFTLLCLTCFAVAEKPSNVLPPNIIIMLMDDVSYLPVEVSSLLMSAFRVTVHAMAFLASMNGALCGMSAVTSGSSLHVRPLLHRWVGETWGCLARYPERPPTWTRWLLRECSSPISTRPTLCVLHVSPVTDPEEKHGNKPCNRRCSCHAVIKLNNIFNHQYTHLLLLL